MKAAKRTMGTGLAIFATWAIAGALIEERELAFSGHTKVIRSKWRKGGSR